MKKTAFAAIALAAAAAGFTAGHDIAPLKQMKRTEFTKPTTPNMVANLGDYYTGASSYRRAKKGYTRGYYSRHQAKMKCKKYCRSKK